MRVSAQREKVRFISDGTECVAWHYPGRNGACVVMGAGGAVTKEPGTDPFAGPFHEAGFSVLAFDYRRLGESGGRPRQVLRMGEQLADWRAAIRFAATLPEVDPERIAIWGFSLSGGHIFRAAAGEPRVAAAIAQMPLADGLNATPKAGRHQRPSAMLRFTGRGLLDAVGGLFGRPPLLVSLAGEPGTISMLTTPDGQDGDRALNPGNRYPDWPQVIAARSALRITLYRPSRHASRVRCPLLVVVCEQDQTAPPGPAIRAARRAPRGELVRLPGGHYAPFLDAHEQALDAELSFLRRHLLDRAEPEHRAAESAAPRTGRA
ncbi:alpha/beta hydrolase [Actinoallomurus liliacearum]|uniref:Alpha/beta hydrolase n=1 Tax=Actinoallomurus liliacearum TaxID=1080073 RepID=A0ABP8TDM5_9ACTN